jgi:hypothetical protein
MPRRPPTDFSSEPDDTSKPAYTETTSAGYGDSDAQDFVVVEEPRVWKAADYTEVVRSIDYQPLDISGIDEVNIRTCADLAYIHYFERAFIAVEALGQRFLRGGMALHPEVASDVWDYIRASPNHLSANVRNEATARAFEGNVMGLVEELDGILMDLYRASNPAVGGGDLGSPDAQRAAALVLIEEIQQQLSQNGSGAGHFLAFELGQQLVRAFKILGSEHLSHCLSCDYDGGIPGNIDHILASGGTAGASPRSAHREAKLAVETRLAFRTLADCDLADPPSHDQLLSLAASTAVLLTVSGERRERQPRLPDESAAVSEATVVRMVRASA